MCYNITSNLFHFTQYKFDKSYMKWNAGFKTTLATNEIKPDLALTETGNPIRYEYIFGISQMM